MTRVWDWKEKLGDLLRVGLTSHQLVLEELGDLLWVGLGLTFILIKKLTMSVNLEQVLLKGQKEQELLGTWIRGKRIAAKFEAKGKKEMTYQRLITAMLTPTRASTDVDNEKRGFGKER